MGANFGHIIIYYTTFPTSPEYGLTPPWKVEHRLGMSMMVLGAMFGQDTHFLNQVLLNMVGRIDTPHNSTMLLIYQNYIKYRKEINVELVCSFSFL